MRINKKKWISDPDNLIRLEGWARDGLSDEQIAKNIGISVKTLYNWKNENLPVLQALKRGKEVVDRVVENALLKRALGYEYEEVTEERKYNVDIGDYELIVTKRVIKHEKPDTTAQIFWLKNRRPDIWRDKRNIEMEATVNNPFDGISTEDIERIVKEHG